MRLPCLLAIATLTIPACSPEAEDATGLHWKQPMRVAVGEAHVGPWRMNASDFRYVDDPAVAVAPGGTVGVVWVDQERKDVFFRRYDGESRSVPGEPVNVSNSPEIFSWLPRVIMDGAGDIFVLWQEIVFSGGSHGGEIFFARSTNGGRSFSEPMNLSNTPNGAGNPHLLFELFHNRSQRGTGLALALSGNAGESFDEPRAIPRGADDPRGVNGSLQGLLMDKLAISPEGGVIVVNSTFEKGQASHIWLLRGHMP